MAKLRIELVTFDMWGWKKHSEVRTPLFSVPLNAFVERSRFAAEDLIDCTS